MKYLLDVEMDIDDQSDFINNIDVREDNNILDEAYLLGGHEDIPPPPPPLKESSLYDDTVSNEPTFLESMNLSLDVNEEMEAMLHNHRRRKMQRHVLRDPWHSEADSQHDLSANHHEDVSMNGKLAPKSIAGKENKYSVSVADMINKHNEIHMSAGCSIPASVEMELVSNLSSLDSVTHGQQASDFSSLQALQLARQRSIKPSIDNNVKESGHGRGLPEATELFPSLSQDSSFASILHPSDYPSSMLLGLENARDSQTERIVHRPSKSHGKIGEWSSEDNMYPPNSGVVSRLPPRSPSPSRLTANVVGRHGIYPHNHHSHGPSTDRWKHGICSYPEAVHGKECDMISVISNATSGSPTISKAMVDLVTDIGATLKEEQRIGSKENQRVVCVEEHPQEEVSEAVRHANRSDNVRDAPPPNHAQPHLHSSSLPIHSRANTSVGLISPSEILSRKVL